MKGSPPRRSLGRPDACARWRSAGGAIVLALLVRGTPAAGADLWADLIDDHRAFYAPGGLIRLAAGVGVAGSLANTSADRDFQDAYQERFDGETLRDAARALRYAGMWERAPLAWAAAGLLAVPWRHTAPGGAMVEWSARCLRALAVGTPPTLVIQRGLGGARPRDGDSAWRPLEDDVAASGHALVGAIPLLTAARMVKSPLLRSTLYAASTLTAWSRVHNDDHYLSQAALGWWMGWLATSAVGQSPDQLKKQGVEVGPCGDGVYLAWWRQF